MTFLRAARTGTDGVQRTGRSGCVARTAAATANGAALPVLRGLRDLPALGECVVNAVRWGRAACRGCPVLRDFRE